jgi:hypothetical protein
VSKLDVLSLVFVAVLLICAALSAPDHAIAADIQLGDTARTIDAAPLRAGTETIMTVAKGTTVTARKIIGDFVLVTVTHNGTAKSGWIHAKHLDTAGEPAVPASGDTRPAASSLSVIRAEQFQPLRQAVQNTVQMTMEDLDALPTGWFKSKIDPMRILRPFKTLKLKEGLVLRAYQFHEQGNGNAVVWAIPADAEFAEPEEVMQNNLGGFFDRIPRPSKAYDNFMEAIEGDRSPESFFSASLLSRELKEFGSMWHGITWGAHTILVDDPWDSSGRAQAQWIFEPPSQPSSNWEWHAEKPDSWLPTVTISGDTATVVFYTYCPIGREGIYKHVDEYRPGEYRFTTEQKKIATGPQELAF